MYVSVGVDQQLEARGRKNEVEEAEGMNYVLVYVYATLAETALVRVKKESFVSPKINIRGNKAIWSTDRGKDQVEIVESPSKPIYNSKFFNLDNSKAKRRENIREEDKVKWASFEARRFTYKLGRYNKKLRKVKDEKKQIYNNFNVDDDELKKLNLKSRSLTSSIETFRKYRKKFLKYLKGLHLKNQPIVPYVPTKLRSEKIPAKYYNLSQEPKNKAKKVNKKGNIYNKEKKDKLKEEKQEVRKRKDEKEKYSEFMSILAEIKGRKYYRGRIY
ncbi:conserved hypothetical protein [Theileria orientalis strain Shintoku]|uniref:Uncharacterized protein n=1 Tax=Theileria orientalis strain Shintoku TaxID=869250 RepID=J4D6J7_THEOR|nr:conserved hypothetical protein [Theileria orientalis strain Shintoku]PVC49622.1 hypothetical protein MACL_00002933 [Theileria orientalis]BAM39620.1 conserved hypothetical protein [Theileria orientalis strain Shintoku]|eukprot:XP_009689921.1 conserved hypothetical protein [Theileria orientalis strain Shintoku]